MTLDNKNNNIIDYYGVSEYPSGGLVNEINAVGILAREIALKFVNI